MEFDVFGKHIQILRDSDGWKAYYLGESGRKRLASDILIPSHIEETELEKYLDDLCHEWATERHYEVKRLK